MFNKENHIFLNRKTEKIKHTRDARTKRQHCFHIRRFLCAGLLTAGNMASLLLTCVRSLNRKCFPRQISKLSSLRSQVKFFVILINIPILKYLTIIFGGSFQLINSYHKLILLVMIM